MKLADFFPMWVAAAGGQVLSDDGRTAMLDSPEASSGRCPWRTGTSTSSPRWPRVVLAASVVTTVPMLLLFLFAQRFFVQGIATTGRGGA